MKISIAVVIVLTLVIGFSACNSKKQSVEERLKSKGYEVDRIEREVNREEISNFEERGSWQETIEYYIVAVNGEQWVYIYHCASAEMAQLGYEEIKNYQDREYLVIVIDNDIIFGTEDAIKIVKE